MIECEGETDSVTKVDNGKTIIVSVKKDFVIKLKANPSTGYDWQTLKIDTNIIKLKQTSYKPDRDIPGSSSMERITFTSLAKGKTVLTLGYLRAWEGRSSMVDSFEVTVKVR